MISFIKNFRSNCSHAWETSKKNRNQILIGTIIPIALIKMNETRKLLGAIIKIMPPWLAPMATSCGALTASMILVSKWQGSKSTDKINIEDPGFDLTQKARLKKLDAFQGREEIIDSAIQALLLKDKPNVLIIGPPGVGKTAIVEGIAQRIVDGKVPKTLLGKRIITIKMSDITASATYIGQREGRIAKLIKDVIQDKNTIVFIDEVHTIMKGGANDSPDNLQNNLKPHLARGDFQVIGCTTEKESEIIFQDSAFARRFSVIKVKEPNGPELFKIIASKAEVYARHHGCAFPTDVIQHAISKGCHLPGHNPDKTLSLLDHAGARALMKGELTVGCEDIDAVI